MKNYRNVILAVMGILFSGKNFEGFSIILSLPFFIY